MVDGCRLWRALLPSRCPLCATVHEAAGWLCPACLSALPRSGPSCPRCARPSPEGRCCGACLRRPPPFDAACAALRYQAPVDHLIHAFKFRHRLGLAQDLGRLLAAHVAPQADTVEAVLPVPLHGARLRTRGFNQSWLLARALAARLGLPARRGRLRRVRATAVQSTLDGAARRRNLHQAFKARGPLPERVALVDDVLTTGATVAAASAALKAAGVRFVTVWVVARAGD